MAMECVCTGCYMGDMLDYVSELRERNRVLESTVQELKDSIEETEEECADKINCLEWKLYYVEQALSDLRSRIGILAGGGCRPRGRGALAGLVKLAALGGMIDPDGDFVP